MDRNDTVVHGCHSGVCNTRMTSRDQKLKAGIVTRLNRAEGQIRGIKGMIEKDVYCDEVLTQIAAIQSALNSIGKLVLGNHIKGCLLEKIRSGENEVVDELLVTMSRLL